MNRTAFASYADTMIEPNIVRLNNRLNCVAFRLMKIIPAKHIIEAGIKSGRIKPTTTIIETSSGTFALGMAMVCNQLGLKSIIVSDPVIDESLRRRLNDLGCHVDIVEKPCSVGGYQTARLNKVHEYLSGGGDYFWTQQYDNPGNPEAYESVAHQLVDALGPIDCLVGPVGSGGSMSGLLSALSRINGRKVIGIAVDTNHSVLFGQPDGPRPLRGLGNSIMPRNLSHQLFDEVHWVDASTAFHNTRQLHHRYGVFCGPTSGAAYTVACWFSENNPEKNVAVVFPDEGYRYLDTVYNDLWLAQCGYQTTAQSPALVSSPIEGLEHDWSRMNWNHASIDMVQTACCRKEGG